MASILDMAFQLLMFFVLTFNLTPSESQIACRLPLPEPVTQIDTPEVVGAPPIQNVAQNESKAVVITALATDKGQIKDLAVGETIVADLTTLQSTLQRVMHGTTQKATQVVIQVDSKLSYLEVMKLVDACTQQTQSHGGSLSKLRFVELRAANDSSRSLE